VDGAADVGPHVARLKVGLAVGQALGLQVDGVVVGPTEVGPVVVGSNVVGLAVGLYEGLPVGQDVADNGVGAVVANGTQKQCL